MICKSLGTCVLLLGLLLGDQALARATNSFNEEALQIVVTESLTTAQAFTQITLQMRVVSRFHGQHKCSGTGDSRLAGFGSGVHGGLCEETTTTVN